jgi:hypothetical protein
VLYVTDLRHYTGIELDLDAPAPALRFARYLSRAVRAATAVNERGPRPTALPCRRRPGRRACPGRLVVEVQDLPSRVRWECPACGEAGIVDGWQGSEYDLSQVPRAEGAEASRAVLPERAYELLLGSHLLERDSERVVYAARPCAGGVELSGSEEEFDALSGTVAFESNHAPTREAQRRWDEVFECLMGALEPDPPPRRTWLERSTAVVIEELGVLGLVGGREQVAALVRERLGALAAGLRITERSARRYLGEEQLRGLAREVAVQFAEERPGADLLSQPRTVPVPLDTFGRTVAALAEAGHVRVANSDAVGAHGALQLLSLFGQVVAGLPAPGGGQVFLPQAALARGARLLEATAEMLRQGAALAPDLPAGSGPGVAEAFARDAATLRSRVAEHGTPAGPTPGS